MVPLSCRTRGSGPANAYRTEGKPLTTGQEWLVEIWSADVEALKDRHALSGLFAELIELLHLKVIGEVHWHTFPDPGGITGLALLSESHLCVHTFPERQYAALNVYSCRERPAPDFGSITHRWLRTHDVTVRELPRGARREELAR